DDGTLLETWRAFVDADGRVKGAAAALDVHENTVRYRLGKIKGLTGLDPSGLEALLSARPAFQILSFANPGPPPSPAATRTVETDNKLGKRHCRGKLAGD